MNYIEIAKDVDQNILMNIIGISDSNLLCLEKLYNFEIIYRDGVFKCFTDNQSKVDKLARHLDILIDLSNDKIIDHSIINYTFEKIMELNEENLEKLDQIYGYTNQGRAIKPKTLGQKYLLEAIDNNTITFVNGPAGTGKTYLSVLMAVNALKNNDIKRIVLTRPAVEAGENLGFLPGDLKEKVDPYLTPLYDCLYDFLGVNKTEQLIESEVIEIAPLAYMRGRTLDNAFIILDEAQNTTSGQMKMFLTRLGYNSKMVIVGDSSQVDIELKHTKSALKEAMKLLEGIDDIANVCLNLNDVVRNHLVLEIIKRYEGRV